MRSSRGLYKKSKLVFGVGINDADYVTQKFEVRTVDGVNKRVQVWICPFYRCWRGMLERCYSKREQTRHPNYIGCFVSDSWLRFSNFKSWMEKQCWQGKQLDKDILFYGNKMYSESTCVFVDGLTNKFLTEVKSSIGLYPTGVDLDKTTNKFRAQCHDPFTKNRDYLGLFSTADEAHQAWRLRKYELAKKLASLQTDDRVAEALINRYKV